MFVSILSQSGITDMTDVQAKTYKHISNNKDVIVCSGTGTGKTLAYLCPIISHITGNNNSFSITMLILALRITTLEAL